MACIRPTVAAVLFAALALAPPARAEILARWTQYVVGGAEIRIVTDDPSCPDAAIDGNVVETSERVAPDAAFPVRICAVAVSGEARDVRVGGELASAPPRNVRRVVVIGDTGCRLTTERVQDCDDPKAWPFARIAATAASLRPDLVIHVGDYFYREEPCPPGKPGCADSPSGDIWPAWAADFFTPAAPLLAAAPLVAVRGNHEACARGGIGWTRLLSPEPYDAAGFCLYHHAPYLIAAGSLRLATIDSAAPPDPRIVPALAALYAPEFAWLAEAAAAGETWFLTHRPLWGVLLDDKGRLTGGSLTLAAAAGHRLPPALALALSGHIHLLQALDFAGSNPPQLVVGTGGTDLDDLPSQKIGALDIAGQRIERGISLREFGFLLLEREGGFWRGRFVAPDGATLAECTIRGRDLDCAPAVPMPPGDAR